MKEHKILIFRDAYLCLRITIRPLRAVYRARGVFSDVSADGERMEPMELRGITEKELLALEQHTLDRIATALEILAGIRGRTPHLKLQEVPVPEEEQEEEPVVPDWDDLDVHERDRLYQWLRVDFEKEHPTAFWHPEDLIAIYRKMSPEGKLEILKAARVVE